MLVARVLPQRKRDAARLEALTRSILMARAAAPTSRIRPGRTRRAISVPVSGTALLLIDVINDLAFEGSAALVEQAEPMANRLASLKRRASAAGVPTIYINDNFGQWRSDFRQTVTHCTSRSSPGRRVSERLRPTSRDYFVLKPKHSGFFDTTLDTLLDTLRIRRVILTGIAGNICVLFTANDAYMRELKTLRARRLHRLEHRGGQRPRPAPDPDRAEGKRRGSRLDCISSDAPGGKSGGRVTTGRKPMKTELDKFYDRIDEMKVATGDLIRCRAQPLRSGPPRCPCETPRCRVRAVPRCSTIGPGTGPHRHHQWCRAGPGQRRDRWSGRAGGQPRDRPRAEHHHR